MAKSIRGYQPLTLDLVMAVKNTTDRATQVYYAWELAGACLSLYPGQPEGLVGFSGPSFCDASQITFRLDNRFTEDEAIEFAQSLPTDGEPGKVQGIIPAAMVFRLLAWAIGIALGV